MTLKEAEVLATRTLAAIGHPTEDDWDTVPPDHATADRARVASDLAGLEQHHPALMMPGLCARCFHADHPCDDARRYSDGLIRTADLYGVQP